MKKSLLLICLFLLLLVLVGCSCEKEDKFTVKFTTYTDEIVIEKQKIGMDGLVASPTSKMERAGYKFLGWYNGQKKWDFEKDRVTENITLTAKWEMYLSFIPAEDGSNGLWVVGCVFDIENAVIPKEYSTKSVTGIHLGFADRKKLKTVTVPSTVTYVSQGAFDGCDSLTTIYCEAEQKPQGWEVSLDNINVVWGHKK